MFTQFNLYHVDITEHPHLHVFAPQRGIADVLIQAYLITKGVENRSYEIHDAVPQNLSLIEREHLQIASAQNISGLGIYDSDQGWEIFSVFDYPEQHSRKALYADTEAMPYMQSVASASAHVKKAEVLEIYAEFDPGVANTPTVRKRYPYSDDEFVEQ